VLDEHEKSFLPIRSASQQEMEEDDDVLGFFQINRLRRITWPLDHTANGLAFVSSPQKWKCNASELVLRAGDHHTSPRLNARMTSWTSAAATLPGEQTNDSLPRLRAIARIDGRSRVIPSH
jgi:hypothetical protein